MLALPLLLTLAAFEPEALLPGKPYALKGHTESVVALALSPDGSQLASASRDKTVRVWSLSTGQAVRTISGAQEQLSSVAFSGDGKTLAIGDVGLHVRVVDLESGRVTRELAHPDGVAEVSLNADGSLVAVGGLTEGGAAWDVATGKKKYEFRGRSVRFTADGKTLLIGSGLGTFSLLDGKTGKVKKTVKAELPSVLTTMNPAGTVIAAWTGGGRDVKLFDETGKALATLKGPSAASDRRQAFISGVAVSPDGKKVLVGGTDGVLRLWTVESGAITTSWPVDKSAAVAISGEGTWLAVTDSTLVKLWKTP